MDSLNVKDLLLAPRLDPQQVTDLLKPYGFENPVNADANLQAMTAEPTERQLLADVVEDVLRSPDAEEDDQ